MSDVARQLKLFIYTRLDVSSSEVLELRDMNLSSKEYTTRLAKLSIKSIDGHKLLRHLADYDSGFYRPEKCDVYEPVREVFDPDNLSDPVRWLAQPGGRVLFKKKKPFKYEGFLENMRLGPVWCYEGKKQVVKKGVPDPIFVTEWCLWIDLRVTKWKSLDDVKQFFVDLFLVSEGDYGVLAIEEDVIQKNYLTAELGARHGSYFAGTKLELSLPGMYWANVFGKMYVDWFGKDKFVSLPCFHKKELRNGSYYVQSSDDPFYYLEPDGDQITWSMIDHLDRRAFFDINQPFRECIVPDFEDET